jgi:T4 bacteriophage base plate protein
MESTLPNQPARRQVTAKLPTKDENAAKPAEVGAKPETQYAVARTSYIVELPSKGRFYTGEMTDGNVEIYLLTAAEDKILSDLTTDNIPEIFDSILARCIKTTMSPEDMLETDRYYLLLQLRAYSLGDEYKFSFECPECSNTFIHTSHIPKEFENRDGAATEEPFFVNLPVSKSKVGLRMMRGKDTKEINRYRKQIALGNPNNTEKGDPAYAYQNAKSITSVDGKTFPDISAAMKWFMALPLKDVRAIRDTITLAYPGVINRVTIHCPRCEKDTLSRVPISPLFFFD